MLKYCINTPPEYTARCVDWQQVEPFLKTFDLHVDQALANIMSLKVLPGTARKLRGLPEDLGGLAMYRLAGYMGQKGQLTCRLATRRFSLHTNKETHGFLRNSMDNNWKSFHFETIFHESQRVPLPAVSNNVPPAHPPLTNGKTRTREQVVCDTLHQLMWEEISRELHFFITNFNLKNLHAE